MMLWPTPVRLDVLLHYARDWAGERLYRGPRFGLQMGELLNIFDLYVVFG